MECVIDKSKLSFPVLFETIEEVQVDDDRFTKVKVYLMHTGLNYNGSIFEKEVVEAAMPSLEYIPIVGFIEESKLGGKDFSDHRYVITKDVNGVRRKYIGQAYGVIKSSADNNAHFEMRMCDDGVEREFLVVEGLMWNMFDDSTAIMNRDTIKGHSMELWEPSVEGYEDDQQIFHFTKFSFRAACILGDDKEPAMQNSTIEVQFTVTDFIKEIQDELNNKYTAFTKFVGVNANPEGGNETMPETKQNAETDFALTVMQQFDTIADIVRDKDTIIDRWKDVYPRYCLVDIQENEVIVIDRKNHYTYYGFAFTMNGDEPVIDWSTGSRKKVVYENFVEGTDTEAPESAFNFSKEIDEIVDKACAKIEAAENDKTEAVTNYNTLKTDYDEMKPKYEQYVKDEQARQEAELDAQKDAEFARFEKAIGADNADFIALKEKKAEMTVEEITSQCSILFTRLNLENNKTNFSKNGSALSVGIMDDDDDDSEGYVVTKYGNIPVKR